MAKNKSDDKIFQAAKTRLGKEIEKNELSVADLVKLCETLTKMKSVELKAEEGDFGEGLT